jgi:hypothetical protein
MELYVGNNRIADLKELAHIRSLSALSLASVYLMSALCLCNFNHFKTTDISTVPLSKFICPPLSSQLPLLSQFSTICPPRDLPKLLILDLSGNPCCKNKDYRPFTIYSLKRLKVGHSFMLLSALCAVLLLPSVLF